MPQSLRLVSFNILEGLRPVPHAEAGSPHLDRSRAEAAQEVIATLAPDILVLNEALFCHQYDGTAVDYAALFGFPHQAAALYDGAWGNAILSRHEITGSEEMRIYNRGGLIAQLTTPAGALTVASYHPHPRRHPENKAFDFSQLVASITGPLIVCGDLNCISPEDDVDRAGLIESFRSFTAEAETAVDRFIDSGRHVFGTLGALGLKDAIPPAGRRYSMPTDLINTEKSSGIRIDHILVNSAIEPLKGEVVHSPASNRASDHHPVMLEFRLRQAYGM